MAAVGGAAAVAVCTLLVAVVTRWVPDSAAGVVYMLGVLATSTRYGLAAGLSTGILSALAFDYFFLPPHRSLSIGSAEDLLVLIVFGATAALASTAATGERRRADSARTAEWVARRDRDLATAAATAVGLDDTLAVLGRRTAHALGAEDGVVHLGTPGPEARAESTLALTAEGHRVGELRLIGAPPGAVRGADAEHLASVVGELVAAGQARARAVDRRLETEAKRRGDAIRTALLRGVSHDLRSPLMAIMSAAGALRMGGREADRAELVESVLHQAERMDRLVGNLLDLSRIQSGAAASSLDWCDVADLIASSIRDLPPAVAGGIDVRIPDRLPLVRADAGQVQRVLENLCDNAVKFSPTDGRVEVTAEAGDGHVTVTVADRGPGILPQELGRIFDPFYRSPSSTGVPGSGLGLTIARGLAEANQATLAVAPNPGGGSRFTLRLQAPRPATGRP
ncbi:MAG: sensor histidine kinase [Gaiellales bacterium]